MTTKKDVRISAILPHEAGEELKKKLHRLGGRRKLSVSMFLIACIEMEDGVFKKAVDNTLDDKRKYRARQEIRIKTASISDEAKVKIEEILKQEAAKAAKKGE